MATVSPILYCSSSFGLAIGAGAGQTRRQRLATSTRTHEKYWWWFKRSKNTVARDRDLHRNTRLSYISDLWAANGRQFHFGLFFLSCGGRWRRREQHSKRVRDIEGRDWMRRITYWNPKLGLCALVEFMSEWSKSNTRANGWRRIVYFVRHTRRDFYVHAVCFV